MVAWATRATDALHSQQRRRKIGSDTVTIAGRAEADTGDTTTGTAVEAMAEDTAAGTEEQEEEAEEEAGASTMTGGGHACGRGAEVLVATEIDMADVAETGQETEWAAAVVETAIDCMSKHSEIINTSILHSKINNFLSVAMAARKSGRRC